MEHAYRIGDVVTVKPSNGQTWPAYTGTVTDHATERGDAQPTYVVTDDGGQTRFEYEANLAPYEAPASATRMSPSIYVIKAPKIERGLRFTAHGQLFEVVGEPILIAYDGHEARVREINDGSEFSGYLIARP